MSSEFYDIGASDELASSQFGGNLATPSLFAAYTKQPVVGPRVLLLLPRLQRAAHCHPCDPRTVLVGTVTDGGRVPGLLTSGRLFHRRRAGQLSGHRAQNAVISKQSGGAAIMVRMPAPQFKISIYLSPISTSDHSSCSVTASLSCLRFDVISRSFCLSRFRLSPRSIRSSSFRSSSVHSSSVFSSTSPGVSVHAS